VSQVQRSDAISSLIPALRGWCLHNRCPS
jgi:hypothetical protein